MSYCHLDALGSVRVVTDKDGQIATTCGGEDVGRHEFEPFGEEWPSPSTTERRLFTGQERDGETGLDYFGARYYRADLGRFPTVAPGQASATVDDPQSWNAQAYVRNNPLRNADPDGRRNVRGRTT